MGKTRRGVCIPYVKENPTALPTTWRNPLEKKLSAKMINYRPEKWCSENAMMLWLAFIAANMTCLAIMAMLLFS